MPSRSVFLTKQLPRTVLSVILRLKQPRWTCKITAETLSNLANASPGCYLTTRGSLYSGVTTGRRQTRLVFHEELNNMVSSYVSLDRLYMLLCFLLLFSFYVLIYSFFYFFLLFLLLFMFLWLVLFYSFARPSSSPSLFPWMLQCLVTHLYYWTWWMWWANHAIP